MTEKDFYKINHFNLQKINYLKVSLELEKKKSFIKKFAKFMIKTFNYFCQSLFIYLFF